MNDSCLLQVQQPSVEVSWISTSRGVKRVSLDYGKDTIIEFNIAEATRIGEALLRAAKECAHFESKII